MVWGGRRVEGSGWGTHVYLWRIHFDIWQNQYNIVKFKNKIKLKKKIIMYLKTKRQYTVFRYYHVFRERFPPIDKRLTYRHFNLK